MRAEHHLASKFSRNWRHFGSGMTAIEKKVCPFEKLVRSFSCSLLVEQFRDTDAAAAARVCSIGAILAELKLCSTQRDLRKGTQIHDRLSAAGYDSNLFVASALMNMYAKCGSMKESWRVFQSMPKRDVVSWNCIILGYAQSGEAELALQLFLRMREEGFVPDSATFLSAVKACSVLAETEVGTLVDNKFVKVLSLERARAMHSLVTMAGYEQQTFVANTLVDMYSKCGSLVDARLVFDAIPFREVSSWNCICLAYAHSGQGKEALEMLSRMQEEGMKPTVITFLAAVKAWGSRAEAGDAAEKESCLEQVRGLHCEAAQREHEQVMQLANTFMDAYAKCGSMLNAREVFDKLQHHDVVSWTCLITGYVQSGEAGQAMQMYFHMQNEGCAPNSFTFVAALGACCLEADLKSGRRVHQAIRNAGLEGEIRVTNALVDFYGKCGSMEEAEQVFSAASHRNFMSWSSLMAGYTRQGNYSRVFSLFEEMKQQKLLLHRVIFLSILTVCSHAGLLDEGKKCFESMRSEHGITPGLEHYSCMVELLGRSNQLEAAVELLKSMPHDPDAVVWISVLNYCWQWKNVTIGRLAFDSLMKMGKCNSAAYVLMSNIYAAVGMWDESTQLRCTLLTSGRSNVSLEPAVETALSRDPLRVTGLCAVV